ncbi:GspE/PulE family protein [Patescibacteria group bacterium]|uniref:Type II/IV secretion system protein n=1 Tax=candidate division WWE3 bacterium TaxID=2053526 RepID=A0A928TTM4_UNCKA|nr:type II/IV secretion system protein [candidate division WWE3 bacterium]MCL4732431.1 GspE/PulE family protein [Patescibacteria group bacterium]MDL1952662.1 type II/IV secretion system protein [Candidatus Uhrbacteria bacterium UHB]RIL01205.1 MAG: hypothetical protein DCC77_01555 [Candidatus Uhrbacteria bacterium]
MDEQILQLLIQQGSLAEKDAAAVRDLMARGKSLEQAAVGGRYVDEKVFTRARADASGLPFVDLESWEMPEGTMELLPEEVVKTYHALPLGMDGDTFVYALLDSRDIRAEEAIDFYAAGKGWKLRQVLVPPSQLKKFLNIGSGIGTEIQTTLAEVSAERKREREAAEEEVENLQELIKGAPVARIVQSIMRNAVEERGSDIHIEPVGDHSRVRYRIDGVLRNVLELPINVHPALVARIKVLANLKLDETRVPQDGRIRQTYGDKKIDFRISVLPVVDNEKVVMRILDTSKGAPTLEQLGYRTEFIQVIKEEIKRSHGLFLVTGPTGSGKSTTLQSCLSLLNDEGVNISTLEDPVEYYIPGVNQSQVRPEIGYTFATGLRSLLRQDPNVIMVGEIRDRETAELAIHAALTGHLIFSTLHTNNAFGLVPRLTDQGVQPFLLAATMNIGIAQRLARRICEACKDVQELDAVTMEHLKRELSAIPKKYFHQGMDPSNPVFYHSKGCPKCKGTGYSGRVAVAEIFLFTERARRLVEKGFPIEQAKEEAKKQDMISVRQDTLLKALEGMTTIEEVYRLSQETSEEEESEGGNAASAVTSPA